MTALADNAVVNRLPPEACDAVLICPSVLERLSDEDQRVTIAVLMAAVKLHELRVGVKPN
jgi:hypothetical protein